MNAVLIISVQLIDKHINTTMDYKRKNLNYENENILSSSS